MKPLSGKVAIVTGAARGIGYEYAVRLAELGAHVAVCDRNLESYKEFAREQERIAGVDIKTRLDQLGVQSLLKQVDVTRPQELRAFVDDVLTKWDRIDVLVCNAGGGGDLFGSTASTLDPQTTRAMLEKNLVSVIDTCTAVIPAMRRQKSGRIITVSSAAGMGTLARRGEAADYAVAKAGVAHYTRLLAQELGPDNINVNGIAPGLIASGQFEERVEGAGTGRLDAWSRKVPLRRLGTPRECANVIEFLATEQSAYVTGQVITVDGGLLG
ncbi:MAG: SDR family NAD(P)-dependent oxidoreductase [Burkholderiaceae bacterium]